MNEPKTEETAKASDTPRTDSIEQAVYLAEGASKPSFSHRLGKGEADRMTMQDRNRHRRQTRIAAGICVDCKDPTSGTTRCRGCTASNSAKRSTGNPPGRPRKTTTP